MIDNSINITVTQMIRQRSNVSSVGLPCCSVPIYR
jgi:hypothetical protein